MVGRLDINTTGLLLFTNSGAVANSLMHPKFTIEREYAVRIFGTVNEHHLKALKAGVIIDQERFAFDKIICKTQTGFKQKGQMNQWYHVIVREGRNRLVRRLWESQGVQVSRLTRVRYGDIKLSRDLKPGAYQDVLLERSAILSALIAKKTQ
jgi:23S rRNA pseudouridine2605 synthase